MVSRASHEHRTPLHARHMARTRGAPQAVSRAVSRYLASLRAFARYQCYVCRYSAWCSDTATFHPGVQKDPKFGVEMGLTCVECWFFRLGSPVPTSNCDAHAPRTPRNFTFARTHFRTHATSLSHPRNLQLALAAMAAGAMQTGARAGTTRTPRVLGGRSARAAHGPSTRPRRSTAPSTAHVAASLLVMLSLFAAVTAVPVGCTMDGTELVSCGGFAGTTLDLAHDNIKTIAPGAFTGLTLTSLCVERPRCNSAVCVRLHTL